MCIIVGYNLDCRWYIMLEQWWFLKIKKASKNNMWLHVFSVWNFYASLASERALISTGKLHNQYICAVILWYFAQPTEGCDMTRKSEMWCDFTAALLDLFCIVKRLQISFQNKKSNLEANKFQFKMVFFLLFFKIMRSVFAFQQRLDKNMNEL